MAQSETALLIDVSAPTEMAKHEGDGGDYGSSGHDLADTGVVHVMVNPDTVTDPVFLIYCKDEWGGMAGVCAMLNYPNQAAAETAYTDMHGPDALGFTVETTVEDYRKLVDMTSAAEQAPQSGDYYAGEFQAANDPMKKKRYYY